MEIEKKLNISLIGLIGSTLLIISEFFPWFSDENLIELFILITIVQIENSFLFLFPLISGSICLTASILVIYKFDFRIKSVILSFVGLGFQFIFFIDYLSQEILFLSEARPGFYIGVIGFLLIISNVIYLLTNTEKKGGLDNHQ
ncbi:MAG: hypothetical protein ACFE8N_00445 [Promethearchaeota archaeon]